MFMNICRPTRFVCFAAALAVALIMGVPETVASEQLKLKRTFGLRGDGESHVQMRSMLAPVARNAKSRSTVSIPVTPVLTVVSKDKVGYVCTLGPRISDALLRAWYAQPMTLGYIFDPDKTKEKVYRILKTNDQKAEDARLIAAINQSLGDDLITDILVIKGTRQMGGGAISKLPFASVLGCAELENSAPAEEPKKAH
jgi:hypothetical protein